MSSGLLIENGVEICASGLADERGGVNQPQLADHVHPLGVDETLTQRLLIVRVIAPDIHELSVLEASADAGDDVDVSTVWLGSNHQWGDGAPLYWETMIFGGEYNEWQWRWPSREVAFAGHDRIAAAVRDGNAPEGASCPG